MMRVAIVGAGVSGVVAAAHAQEAGLDITVFERNKAAGGIWLFDERVPPEPEYPADKPSRGDRTTREKRDQKKASTNVFLRENLPLRVLSAPFGNESVQGKYDVQLNDLEHAPPGPCYETLANNVATKLLQLKLNTWKDDTPDFGNHRMINDYIQDTSRKTNVHDRTIYSTRVEELVKEGSTWKITTTTAHASNRCISYMERYWNFDAVIIASGHYHSCRIPDIPGLTEWKAGWPHRVQHSKSYRNAVPFKDKNILLVGSAVSSTDIARELGPEVNHIYQTSRGGAFDLPTSLLPQNATRVADVASFGSLKSSEMDGLDDALKNDLEPIAIPGTVYLRDESELTNIHHVIICTGYHISLPFLPGFHDDDMPINKANDTILVTDGTQVHNLHKDIFYIPDPTLLFIGVPYFTATFTLFEFQAIAAAAVLAGHASLPSEDDMRKEYREKLERKGTGKLFHSLKDKEVQYVDELMAWVNEGRQKAGLEPVEGHTQLWHDANVARLERLKELFGSK